MSANPTTPKARPVAVSLQKLGEHRGKQRLWIEGAKLSRAGIRPGDRFTVTWEPETAALSLVFGDDGDRVVSRRERHNRVMPIIDVAGESIERALGEGIERAQVVIYRGRIEVTVHPDDVAARERIDRLVTRLRAGEAVETGSVAHGGGVLDHAVHHGLRQSGIRSELAFAIEIDQSNIDAAATRNPIWGPDTMEIHAPVQEVDPGILPKVDVLLAGIPCTGASKSGKAKNRIPHAESYPTAGGLVAPLLQIVKATNPAIVGIENVPDYAFSASAEIIRAALRTWGYQVHETVLEGNDFGALEDRARMVILGVSQGLMVRLDDLAPGREREETLAAILEDIGPDSDRWRPFAHHVAKQVRDAAAGSNFKLNMLDPSATKVGTMGAGYHKDRTTEPHLRHPTDPTLARLLTPTEHARAKTIPPELVDGLSPMVAHRILGQSVIWEAFRALGAHLGESMSHLAGLSVYEAEATFASILEEHPAPDVVVTQEAEDLDAELAPAPSPFG